MLTKGMDRVAPDVFRLRIAFVNVFLIGAPGDGKRWVLIDAGVGRCGGRIARAAEACYGTGTRPEAIILTHGHFDHVGAVRTLAERWDVSVYAHNEELPYLEGQRAYPPADPLAGDGAMAWLSPLYPRGPIDLGSRIHMLPSDGKVPHLPEWRAVHTPGHTPGHVSLFRPGDRVLLAGDALVTTNQESLLAVLSQRPEVRRPPAYFTPDWLAAEQSVIELGSLAPEVIASGHGPTIRGSVAGVQLPTLARRFAELGFPRRGRYRPKSGYRRALPCSNKS